MDRDRVAHLAEALAPDLLRYFVRRIERPEDAADLLSETFLVMARRAAVVPASEEEARMWCFGVARRVLLAYRRRGRRQAELAHRLRDELRRTSAVAPPPDPVHEALARLDHLDQEIIRLLHWDGFTQAEIAAHLDMPTGTVRSRYTRARARLRVILADLAVG